MLTLLKRFDLTFAMNRQIIDFAHRLFHLMKNSKIAFSR